MVFPFVPVIPMIVRSFEGLSWNLEDIIEAAFRVFSILITGLSKSFIIFSLDITADAPFLMASFI